MTINDLPHTESYNLAPPSPARSKLSPRKIVLFVLTLLAVFLAASLLARLLFPRSKVKENLSVVGSLTPSSSSQSAEKQGPFSSLLKSELSPAPASPSVALSPETFSQSDLETALTGFLNDKTLEINENSRAKVYDCQLKGRYLGRRQGENQYGLNDNTYLDDSSKLACLRLSLLESFSETYWVGGLIYTRQDKDQPLKPVSPTEKVVKAQSPADYLSFYFADPKTFKFLSASGDAANFKAAAQLNRRDLSGNFIFNFSAADGRLTGFSYQVSSSQIDPAQPSLRANLTSEVAFTTPTAPIALPD